MWLTVDSRLRILEGFVRYFFEPYPKVAVAIFIVAYVFRLIVRSTLRIQSDLLGLALKFFEPVNAITVLQGIAFLGLVLLISIGFELLLITTPTALLKSAESALTTEMAMRSNRLPRSSRSLGLGSRVP
jgi:uncharacterized membrane protein